MAYKAFSPAIEYWSGTAWTVESLATRFTLTDSIAGRVRVLEAEILNPQHSQEVNYSLYREVRLRDLVTDFVLFYGRVLLVEPTSTFMRVTVKDGLSELAERKVDSLTGGPFTRRSALVSALISQNSYSGNFDLGGIEDSAVTGSFDRNFEAGKEGPTVLSEIQRVAEEDPWDTTPTGCGYDFYVQWVSDTVKQRFYYYKRGSKPSSPVSTNGLTLELGGTYGDQKRPILSGYDFTKEGTGIVTCVRVRYLELKDSSDPSKGKEWAYVEAVNSTLETTIERRKMLVVDRPEINDSTEAQALANAILNRLGRENIQRGHLSFPGFPVIKVELSYSLVRAGHLVHVTGLTFLPSLNDTDMLLTSLEYSWPEHITKCEVLTDPASGSEYSGFDPQEYFESELDKVADLPRQTDTIPTGLPVPPYGPPQFIPALQPFIVNITFSATNYNTVAWTSGTIKFADGTTQSVNAGNTGAMSAKTFIYVIIGNANLQVTTDFSNTVGADRGIVAIARPNSNTAEKATVVSLSGDTPVIAANAIDVAKLSAINADMGLLTAGEIRVGTGTLGKDYTGWRMWVEGGVGCWAGYLNNVRQIYEGSDGRLYVAGGGIQMGDTGILINSAYGTQLLRFVYGSVYANVYLTSGGELSLNPSSLIALQAPTKVSGKLYPSTDQYFSLGDSSQRWTGVYCGNVQSYTASTMYDIYPRDSYSWLGTSTSKWQNGYFSNLPACPVPTSSSALDIIKKIKAPKVMKDDRYGKRHYFKDEDFPSEMKHKKVHKNEKGDIIEENEEEIEFIRTIGVLVQAVRELTEKVEALEATK
jgi:hypothetical protein